MKNKFQSSLLLNAVAITLLALSSSFAQQTTFTSSDYLCKHQNDFPGESGGGGEPGIAASVDGEHFVAIASDENEYGTWSCYSSELDPVSNMSHGWKKRATFVGAYFYGITFAKNNFIITGMKDEESPIILTSGDNGTSWVERRPLPIAVGSDSIEFSITDLDNDASFTNKLNFVSIGSESDDMQKYANESFFVFPFSPDNDPSDIAVGSDIQFIAIGSEDFTFAAFVPAGSDDGAPAWVSSRDFKGKRHHGVRKHKNGSVYWNL